MGLQRSCRPNVLPIWNLMHALIWPYYPQNGLNRVQPQEPQIPSKGNSKPLQKTPKSWDMDVHRRMQNQCWCSFFLWLWGCRLAGPLQRYGVNYTHQSLLEPLSRSWPFIPPKRMATQKIWKTKNILGMKHHQNLLAQVTSGKGLNPAFPKKKKSQA